ncbi:MAG: universal stress protein [bacterium]|nr:universal stress protein [bacterium]
MFDSILVAVDASEAAQAALRHACDLAKAGNAKVTLVNVVDVSKLLAVAGYETPYPVDAIEIMRKDGRQILDDATAICRDYGIVPATQSGEGDAVEEILDSAQRTHADLIVLGTHGRKGLSRLFIGSVAEGVLRRADVPVLVVRQ